MRRIDTELTASPFDYQITSRLAQLVQFYSKNQVESVLFLGKGGNEFLTLHVENLLLTYGVSAVMENFDLIYKRKAA